MEVSHFYRVFSTKNVHDPNAIQAQTQIWSQQLNEKIIYIEKRPKMKVKKKEKKEGKNIKLVKIKKSKKTGNQ